MVLLIGFCVAYALTLGVYGNLYFFRDTDLFQFYAWKTQGAFLGNPSLLVS